MPDTDESGVDETLWRFLRGVYVRLISGQTLHPGKAMTLAEENMVLDPHLAGLEHDHALLLEILGRARSTGIEAMRARLHAAEGVDHDMLDEAMAYALSPPVDE